MRLYSFKRGGIKLNPRKSATEGSPIVTAKVKQVAIPVNQHFGAPNNTLVSVGDKVARGQVIAAADGLMTSPVHASISGTVKKIEPRLLSNNTFGECVIIDSDSTDDIADQETKADCFLPPLDPFTCTKEQALARIKEAGIIGMGGAGFPAHVKLSPPPGKTIDLIIANGCECEPYLTIDEALMTEKPDVLIMGLAIVMQITGVKHSIIAIEAHCSSLIPLLEECISKASFLSAYNMDLKVNVCRALYPQGGEKMLIKSLTGREVPGGGLPMDAHCIVNNVETLIAIAEAFTPGKPLIDTNLTVAGGACKTPKNMCLPIGAMLNDLPPEIMSIDYDYLRKIIYGGPMMGSALDTIAPVQKNTSGILFLTKQETDTNNEDTCIRCARCIKHCACRLSPVIINAALEAQDFNEAVRAGLMDCVECGCCAYVCPGRIKLVQRFRVGKQRLRALKQAGRN